MLCVFVSIGLCVFVSIGHDLSSLKVLTDTVKQMSDTCHVPHCNAIQIVWSLLWAYQDTEPAEIKCLLAHRQLKQI